MTLDQRTVGDVVVLEIGGPLMAGDAATRLRERITSLVFDGHRELVLDLGGISRLDSTGLGTLIAAYTILTKAGGRIVVANLPPRVSDVMAVTKLLTVFDHAETADAGVAMLAARAPKPSVA